MLDWPSFTPLTPVLQWLLVIGQQAALCYDVKTCFNILRQISDLIQEFYKEATWKNDLLTSNPLCTWQ